MIDTELAKVGVGALFVSFFSFPFLLYTWSHRIDCGFITLHWCNYLIKYGWWLYFWPKIHWNFSSVVDFHFFFVSLRLWNKRSKSHLTSQNAKKKTKQKILLQRWWYWEHENCLMINKHTLKYSQCFVAK